MIVFSNDNLSIRVGAMPADPKQKVPLKIWAEQVDLENQDGAIEQALNLARHPTVFHHVALMPDFHQGFGMPIGGVMACLNAVIPNAVGNDIGCGMLAVETNWNANSLSKDELQRLRLAIHNQVPVGNQKHVFPEEWPDRSFGFDFEEAALELDLDDYHPAIVAINLDLARLQLGTLGGGNHFIELQMDERGQLWIMIHSGSRAIGEKICREYNDRARFLNARWHSDIPNNDLAFLPVETLDGQAYLREMEWAMKFAEANRNLILLRTLTAFFNTFGDSPSVMQAVHTHHNYAEQEHHFGQNPWVHRKGAVKADGLVIIPGSMGTASYICEGLNNPESFGSCSHGAGRVMSRTAANKAITHEQAIEMMQHVVFGVKNGDYDEMPHAYKDVDTVIARQSDLVKVVHRLTPLAVVKG